jgi:hypothetical protein
MNAESTEVKLQPKDITLEVQDVIINNGINIMGVEKNNG